MAIPDLNDYEWQLGDDGVLLNASVAGIAASLPFVDITSVSGLDSAPFRLQQADHEGVDGGYVDAEFLTTRTVVLEGTIFAPVHDPETICDALKANWRPSKQEVPLYFKIPNKATRVVFGKPQGARYNIDTLRRTGQTPVQLQMLCPTPYIYDAQEVFASAPIFIVSPGTNGFGFDLGFNLGFGEPPEVTDTGGSLLITNSGNRDAWPVLTMRGPVNNPVVWCNGRFLLFETYIPQGQYLEIDTRKKTALLNGTSNRRTTLGQGSKWFSVPTGTTAMEYYGEQDPPEQQFLPATTNYIKNPSFENDAAGWDDEWGATEIQRIDTVGGAFGDYALEISVEGSTSGPFHLVGAVCDGPDGLDGSAIVGQTVAISLYIWVSSDHVDQIDSIAVAGVGPGLSESFPATFVAWDNGLTDQWQRVSTSVQFNEVNELTQLQVQFWTDGTLQDEDIIAYIDAVQLEAGGGATPYCDGDQEFCTWNGSPHESTSFRDEVPEVPRSVLEARLRSTWE